MNAEVNKFLNYNDIASGRTLQVFINININEITSISESKEVLFVIYFLN